MTAAEYAVVRVVADPARDEPVNVGVVLWSGSTVRLHVDADALEAVTRRNPHLTSGALFFVEDYLRSGLEPADSITSKSIASALVELSRFPVSITEPRYVVLPLGSTEDMESALQAAVARIVRPPQKHGGGRRTARQQLQQLLKPLIDRRIIRENHIFLGRSGNARRVSFFANGDTSLVLEAVSLAVRDADEIMRRSDAVAYKMLDILGENEVRILVHGEFPDDERFHDSVSSARRSIEASGAELVTDAVLAAKRMQDSVSLI